MTIEEIVNKIIGKTEAIGCSEIDTGYFQNLTMLVELTNWCIEELAKSASKKDDSITSINLNGKYAYNSLLKLRDKLDNFIE